MNKFSVGKWACTGLLLLAMGSANAQVSKHGNTYTFRMKFTKGQSISYVMKSSGSAQGQAFTTTMDMTQKVTTVTPAGVATLNVKLGSMAMTLNGKPMNQQIPAAMRNVSYQIDSQGHTKGGTAQQNTSVSLPANGVPIGGTWTATTSTPAMGQAMQVSATYKLLGFENVGSFKTAKISVTMSSTGQMAMSGSGMLWLNTADSSMVKNTLKMNMTVGGMAMPMDISIVRK